MVVTLQKLREDGVTVLMVEQNAKAALAMSVNERVLELGQTRMHDRAETLLADRRAGPSRRREHRGRSDLTTAQCSARMNQLPMLARFR